jgi:hypothetical protein
MGEHHASSTFALGRAGLLWRGFRYERVEFLNMKTKDVAPRQIFSIQETLFHIEKINQNVIEFVEEKFCLV